MPLFHRSIIKLVQHFAPQMRDDGVCSGFTSLWIQAVLSGEQYQDEFYQRIDWLHDEYAINMTLTSEVESQPPVDGSDTDSTTSESQATNDPHETVVKELGQAVDIERILHDINIAQQKVKQGHEISEHDQALLDLRAFCESVAIMQSPELYRDVLGSRFDQRQQDKTYPFVRSKNLEASGQHISKEAIGTTVLSQEELSDLLKDFESVIKDIPADELDENISFYMTRFMHAFSMIYNVESGTWRFMDINAHESFYDGDADYTALAAFYCANYAKKHLALKFELRSIMECEKLKDGLKEVVAERTQAINGIHERVDHFGVDLGLKTVWDKREPEVILDAYQHGSNPFLKAQINSEASLVPFYVLQERQNRCSRHEAKKFAKIIESILVNPLTKDRIEQYREKYPEDTTKLARRLDDLLVRCSTRLYGFSDENAFEALLSFGANPNNKFLVSALIRSGNVDYFSRLISSPNFKLDSPSKSPLMEFAKYPKLSSAQLDCVEELAFHLMDTKEAYHEYFLHPLMLLCQKRNMDPSFDDFAQFLLSNLDIGINATYQGKTLYQIAMNHGNEKLVHHMLEHPQLDHSVLVNSLVLTLEDGQVDLMLTCLKNPTIRNRFLNNASEENIALIEKILKTKDNECLTEFLKCCPGLDVLSYIQRDLTVGQRQCLESHQRSLLDAAIAQGDDVLLKQIIESPSYRLSVKFFTPLVQLAKIKNMTEKHLKCAEVVIDYFTHTQNDSRYMMHPFIALCRHKTMDDHHFDMAKLFMKAPLFDVNKKYFGQPPLAFALSNGHEDVACLLLEHPELDRATIYKQFVRACVDGMPTFALACLKLDEVREALLQNQAEENVALINPLIRANEVEVLSALLSACPSLDVRGAVSGERAVDTMSDACKKLLESHQANHLNDARDRSPPRKRRKR